nr:recombinase family protein [Streptomyces coryli]
MLELAWDGWVEHTEQGWNIGKPPYGYLADRVPHPVPAKREQGASKHRLKPDPARGPVVAEIFRLRVVEQLSYRRIADRLNTDPQSFPPPLPNRRDTASGRWTAAGVRSILENPKYTGYQVWNRKARKTKGNKANPISEWVWSTRPTHEPLITKGMFDAAWGGRATHPGARPARPAQVGREGRSADRSYLLRSYLVCALCGHRMYGKQSKGRAYYACQPKRDHHESADWYAAHPKDVWIGERVVVEAVHAFFVQRIFGPDRHAALQQELQADRQPTAVPHREAEALRAEAERLTCAKERLLDQLVTEDDADGDPATAAEFRRGIRRRYDALETQRRDALARLDELQPAPGGGQGAAGDAALLDALPQLSLRYRDLPTSIQRQIYDAFQLRVRYDCRNRGVEIQATIRAAVLDDLAAIARRAAETAGSDQAADQPLGERPRQGASQKDAGVEQGQGFGRLVISGAFEPMRAGRWG